MCLGAVLWLMGSVGPLGLGDLLGHTHLLWRLCLGEAPGVLWRLLWRLL